MPAIFISYRRDDTEGQAGRLFDDLTRHFGHNTVFMDVTGIQPGQDFRQAVEEQVSSCGVLLAVIGKGWVTAKDQSGSLRLEDPMDFVRLEIAPALKRKIPVVPILVQGAKMPLAEDLPEDLKDLTFRNAVELTHARWDSDVQLLIKALHKTKTIQKEANVFLPRLNRLRSVIVGIVSVLTLASGWYIFHENHLIKQTISINTIYASLQQILKEKNWKKADDETAKIMREIAGKQQQENLTGEDFDKFPCPDLLNIDKLWMKESNEHFGFSVQKRIWLSSDVNGNLGKFVDHVGWGQLKGDNSFFYWYMDRQLFDLSAPAGRLPWAVTYNGGTNETRSHYMSRLIYCLPNP